MQIDDIPTGRGRSPRVCAVCGAAFWVYNAQLRKGGGFFCSRSCAARRPARDGDKKQARSAVSQAIRDGRLPRPDALPCSDCGHLGVGPRHEYDHHLGYAAAHHLSVIVLCAPCHRLREVERGVYDAHFAALRAGHQARARTACVNCGSPKKPFRAGRCDRCRSYFRAHGIERPIRSRTPGHP